MAPLTAAEILRHPQYEHVIWDLEPAQKGKVEVARGRGGPFQIAYEVHGHGARKLVWIMGLAALKSAWQAQTYDFGHAPDSASRYTSLIFDNRGMGESDTPWGRYSTSEMARDVLELLEALRWTGERELHVVGVSMGGMIAQELALLIPERIASLSLISTAARLKNTVGFLENLRSRINLFIPRPLNAQLAHLKSLLFSPSWLAAPDADGGFPTNGDRFAAYELRKRLDPRHLSKPRGVVLQAIATGWHHKSAAEMRALGDAVGRERILVMHGGSDAMISVAHGEVLVRELGGEAGGESRGHAGGQVGGQGGEELRGQERGVREGQERGVRRVVMQGAGHVLMMEQRREFGRLIAEMVDKTAGKI